MVTITCHYLNQPLFDIKYSFLTSKYYCYAVNFHIINQFNDALSNVVLAMYLLIRSFVVKVVLRVLIFNASLSVSFLLFYSLLFPLTDLRASGKTFDPMFGV